jgi:ACS family hexuronate transporter-like MFS transporter
MQQPTQEERSQRWVWWICGLLLLASTINYMDRQTLSSTSPQIKREFSLSDEQYGLIETAFGLAFALGASAFGFVADRTNVRWLYPAVLLLWSVMGFATGLVETYLGLLLCRFFLGLFEAGHWPCALKTTQRLLPSKYRTLGNSVLQSGTAIGAIVTPQIIKAMVTEQRGSWRFAFQTVAAVGSVWIFLWLFSVRSKDLAAQQKSQGKPEGVSPRTDDGDSPRADAARLAENEASNAQVTYLDLIFSRRFLVLVIIVVSINLCWHQFRVWMQLFLEKGRSYARNDALDIATWFNVATDIGCLTTGFATAALGRRGWTAHRARCLAFGICALLTAAGAMIPWLPKGRGLELAIVTVGLGVLGLFPIHYSLSQELSRTHQGRISGTLGTLAWVSSSIWHWQFGSWVDRTKSYDLGMMVASLLPLIALAAIVCLWPRSEIAAKPLAES